MTNLVPIDFHHDLVLVWRFDSDHIFSAPCPHPTFFAKGGSIGIYGEGQQRLRGMDSESRTGMEEGFYLRTNEWMGFLVEGRCFLFAFFFFRELS